MHANLILFGEDVDEIMDKFNDEKHWIQFIEDEYGDEIVNGKKGYYKNPNGLWDWFVIGGRWEGGFLKKKDRIDERSGKPIRPGFLTEEDKDAHPSYDQARAHEIWMDEISIPNAFIVNDNLFQQSYADDENTILKFKIDFLTALKCCYSQTQLTNIDYHH